MKIIILGAGRVGESVAEHLVSERNDITVIDNDPELLGKLQERFDLRGILGDGSQPSVLADAGADDADLLLACAADDAVNLTVCKTAFMRFHTPHRIARLRSTEWSKHMELLGEDGFAVSNVICPEASVTRYIQKLVEYPEAMQVRDFAHGMASMVSVRATAGAPMVGQPIRRFSELLPDASMHVMAIYRRFANEPDRFVPCRPDSVILPGDEVFFFVARDDIRAVLKSVHSTSPPVRRVVIAGGGNVGLHLARVLQKHVHLKLIDSNRARCEYLATQLDESVLILHGDSTDEDLLSDENIHEVDFFVASTNDDENNIMGGLLAKQLGATRVLSLVNRRSYADLVHGTQIDIALSPAQAMMGELLTHIRQGDVYAVHSARRGNAEAIELAAHGDRRTSRVVGRTVGQIPMPEDVRIGLIVRGLPDLHTGRADDDADAMRDPDSEYAPFVLSVTDDTVIQPGDHVLLFVPHRRLVPAVEKLFRVKATFF